MAANEDIVKKIFDLQGKIDAQVIPAYEQAKAAVDDYLKQLDALKNLPKMTTAQGKQYSAITGGAGNPGLLATAQDAMKANEKPAQEQAKVQANFDEFMRQLQSRTPNMGPKTAAEYDSLKSQAFSGNDPQAQQAFHRYVSTLQTVPAQNITKELRKYVQDQLKQGLKVSATAFAEQSAKLSQGSTFGPEENPEIKRQLESASATGWRRGWSNFKSHINNGEGIALGSAAMGVAQAGVGVADTYLDGRRYTAEARERAYLGLAPGIGGLLGAGIGAFTPLGPIGGGLIGGGIGTAVQGVFSAQSERTESIRLAAEEITLQMGRGTVAAGKFADIIDETAKRLGVPAQELAASSSMIAKVVTGFSAGGVNLQARLASTLGDNYAQFAPSQAAFAGTPFSRPYRDMLAGTAAPSSDLYGDAAFMFAFTGDQDNMKKQLAMKHAIDPPAGYQQYVADKQAAKPMGWWEATKNAVESVFAGTPTAPILDMRAAQRRVGTYESTQQKTIAAVAKSAQSDTDFYNSVYEDSRRGRETFAFGQAKYAAPRIGMEMAQESGKGLAGMRAFAPAEEAALSTEQGGLMMQAALLQKRLADKSLTGDRRTAVQLLMAGVSGQLAGVRQQQLEIPIQLFREGVAERHARFEGGYSRLGIGAEELTLGGASAFDPRVRRNLAQRRSFLAGQSAYDLGLASDMTNYLSPMEREERKTAAKRERFEADFALPNAYALARIGETQARSGERQAGFRGDVARAQVTGGVIATLTAENRLIDDQKRLRDELNARLKEGHLTTQQQLQVTTQIRDLDSQIVTGRKQAMDTAFEGFSARAQARSEGSYAQGGREAMLRGTSAASNAENTQGYDASLRNVALLKLRRDTALSPDQKEMYDRDYQVARAGAERQGIDAFSQVSMSPDFETRQVRLAAKLSRQERSPFEPGNVLQSNAELAKMGGQKLAAIQAQMKRVRDAQDLTPDQKLVVLRNLTGQEEETKTDIFERQQSVDVGWIDRLVSQSVNAPSFAARLMPGSDRVADFAERRGLGRMSARVFGYRSQQSYRDAEGMGVLPSETSRFAFGMRPGDFPFGDTPDAPVVGGRGITTDSIEAGTTGAMPEVLSSLTGAIGLLNAILGKGLQIHVNQINPETGQAASQTQNAQTLYNAHDIMRGGAGAVGNGMHRNPY